MTNENKIAVVLCEMGVTFYPIDTLINPRLEFIENIKDHIEYYDSDMGIIKVLALLDNNESYDVDHLCFDFKGSAISHNSLSGFKGAA